MPQTLEQVAHDLGFEVVDEPDGDVRFGLEKALGNVTSLTIESLIEKRSEDVRFAVADVSYRNQSPRDTVAHSPRNGPVLRAIRIDSAWRDHPAGVT